MTLNNKLLTHGEGLSYMRHFASAVEMLDELQVAGNVRDGSQV